MTFEFLVGPVKTAGAATALESAGATIVGVTPDPLPRFDPRAPTLDAMRKIRDALTTAELCLFLGSRQQEAQIRRLNDHLRPGYVAMDVRHGDAVRLRPVVPTSSKLLLYGLWLDYDEDPKWVEARLREYASRWEPTAFVLTLLPGLKHPAKWLRTESGRHEEDVRLSELESVIARFPCFVNMEIGEADVGWVCQQLRQARGIAFFSGEARNDGGSPVVVSLNDAMTRISQVITALKTP